MDAVMVMGNSHLFMGRNNKLAVIASHLQERYESFISSHTFRLYLSSLQRYQNNERLMTARILQIILKWNSGFTLN